VFKMINIEEFDKVFKSVSKNHFPTHLHDQIKHAEADTGNPIFFNLLLKTLNIPATHLYPPRVAKEFRELHRQIAGAKCQLHHKQSLLYYLLRDCCLVAKDKEERAANQFATECSLPNKYVICMQGLWDMDKQNYKVNDTRS
jgi:protein ELYS